MRSADEPSRRRLAALIALFGLALGSGCAAPCSDSLGAYPPDHILVIGMEAVEVPHIAWTCVGFHSDSMEPPPSVAPDPEQRLRVEVTLEPGTTVDARFGNSSVAVEPAPADGLNRWTLHVPQPSQPLIIDLCAADGRCAMYWVNTYPG